MERKTLILLVEKIGNEASYREAIEFAHGKDAFDITVVVLPTEILSMKQLSVQTWSTNMVAPFIDTLKECSDLDDTSYIVLCWNDGSVVIPAVKEVLPEALGVSPHFIDLNDIAKEFNFVDWVCLLGTQRIMENTDFIHKPMSNNNPYSCAFVFEEAFEMIDKLIYALVNGNESVILKNYASLQSILQADLITGNSIWCLCRLLSKPFEDAGLLTGQGLERVLILGDEKIPWYNSEDLIAAALKP